VFYLIFLFMTTDILSNNHCTNALTLHKNIDITSSKKNDISQENIDSPFNTINHSINMDSSELLPEPLLTLEDKRYSLFPIKNDILWNMYNRHESTFWTAKELDLKNDYNDFQSLSDAEKRFITYVLAFFAGSDILVMDNINTNFLSEIKPKEAQAFFGMQNAIEQIHSETYSLLIDVYVKNESEKHKLFNAIQTIPTITQKAQWCYTYMNNDLPFAQRLVAFILVEGLFFCSSFCAIFYLKQKYPGKLAGLVFSNELIARDESLHAEFSVLLYNEFVTNKLSENKIYEMFQKAVAIEQEFVEDSIPVAMLGMNANLMTQYVKFIADRLLKQLNYKPLYKVANPFDFMEAISIETKTNFFDQKVAEYSRSGAFNTNKEFTILQDGF